MNKFILNSIVPNEEEVKMLDNAEVLISADEIKQSVLEKIENDNGKGSIYMLKKRKIAKTLVAAAVVVCMTAAICATSFAAKIVYDKFIDSRVTDAIGNGRESLISETQKADDEQVMPAIATPLAQAESNGVKLSVVQTVGDGENVYVLVEAEVPEKYDIYKRFAGMEVSSFEKIEVKVENQDLITAGTQILNDGKSKNKATFLFDIVNDGGELIGKNISITFKNLKSEGELPSINGEWELKWKMSYKDISSDITPDEKINLWGTEAEFEKMSISPFSLSFELKGDFNNISVPAKLKEGALENSAPHDYLCNAVMQDEVIKVTFKDGTRCNLEDIGNGRFSNSDCDRLKLVATFGDYISPEQVASVEIFGNSIAVDVK